MSKDFESSSDADESNDSDGDLLRRGLSATDLYDLTLTAVAFLGFGSFVMNLVMDAMAVSSTNLKQIYHVNEYNSN